MDAQQIKDLIQSKIAGQGTMVDAGGGLPTILNAIVDLISDTPAPSNNPILTIDRQPTKLGRWLLTDEENEMLDQRSIIGVKLPTIYEDEILLYNSSIFKEVLLAQIPESINEAFPNGLDIQSAYGRIDYVNGADGVAIDTVDVVVYGTGEDVDGVDGEWLVEYSF